MEVDVSSSRLGVCETITFAVLREHVIVPVIIVTVSSAVTHLIPVVGVVRGHGVVFAGLSCDSPRLPDQVGTARQQDNENYDGKGENCANTGADGHRDVPTCGRCFQAFF